MARTNWQIGAYVSAIKLTVSVVVYKSSMQDLELLFNSLRGLDCARVCVIDNFGDDLLAQTTKAHGWHYLKPARNLGYGKGHNLGFDSLKKYQAPTHLVVNPDISFTPDAVTEMLRYMDANPNIGLLMPQVRFADGRIQRLCKLLPSPFDLIARRFLPDSKFKRRCNARYELADWNYQEIAEIPVLSGCFMLLNRDVFASVGGFDPGYFMYLEDTDLCRRIGLSWVNCYYPLVSVTHGYAKGSYSSRKLLFFHIASSLRYFFRWGWLFDSYRAQRNKRTLDELGL